VVSGSRKASRVGTNENIIMKTKKLGLSALKVASFVTTFEKEDSKTLAGGRTGSSHQATACGICDGLTGKDNSQCCQVVQ